MTDVEIAVGCTRLDPALDLQAAGNRLIVLYWDITCLDLGLNLQAAGNGLVVLLCHNSSPDAALELQAARHCLLVLRMSGTGLDAALDLQAAIYCLVVVAPVDTTRFNLRFDFHMHHFLSFKSLKVQLLTLDYYRRIVLARFHVGFDFHIRHFLSLKCSKVQQSGGRPSSGGSPDAQIYSAAQLEMGVSTMGSC